MNLDQIYISAVAFCAVFVMLTVLAALMALLTRVFPGEAKKTKVAKSAGGDFDEALIAAVTTAVTTAIPQGRVTKIKEVR